MAVVNEVVTLFKYEGSVAPIQNYNKSLKDSIGLAAKAAAGIAAAAGGIYYFTTSTLDGVDALNQLSRETGTSIERLQELGYIASVNGSSLEDVKQSVSALSEAIGRAANGDKAYGDIFKDLGISIRDEKGNIKDATRMIYDLNEAFAKKGLSKQEQAGYIKKLRLNKRLIQMLGLEKKQMDKLALSAKKMGIVSSENADRTSDMFDAITTAKFAISGLTNDIALAFVLAVTSMANAIIPAIEFTRRMSHMIDIAVSSTVGWDNAMYGLTAAVIYFNRKTIKALARNPIVWIAGAVVGLTVAIDDLWVGIHGGKSVLRDVGIDLFGKDLKNLIPWIKETKKELSELFSFENMAKAFDSAAQDLYDSVMKWFDMIKKYISDTIGSIGKLWDSMIPDIGDIFGGDAPIMSPTSVTDTHTTTAIKQPVQVSGGTTVNNVTIDIKTNDPHTVGNDVGDVFSKVTGQKVK